MDCRNLRCGRAQEFSARSRVWRNGIGFRLVPIGYFAGVTLLGALDGHDPKSAFEKQRSISRAMDSMERVGCPGGHARRHRVRVPSEGKTQGRGRALALAFAVYPAVIGLVMGHSNGATVDDVAVAPRVDARKRLVSKKHRRVVRRRGVFVPPGEEPVAVRGRPPRRPCRSAP